MKTRIPEDSRGSVFGRRGPSRSQQLGLLVVLALLAALAVMRVVSAG